MAMEQEKLMNKTVKQKQLIIAVSDCILSLFLGLVYAWSIFKKPLATAFGWSDTQMTWTFTINMSFFCIGGFWAAKASKKIRHQLIVIFCGISIFLGFLLTSRISVLPYS